MSRRDVAYRVSASVYLVVLLAACVAVFWPVYQNSDFVVMAIGAIGVAAAVAVCGAVWRWSSLVTTLVALIAFLALGVPLAIPGETLWRVLPTWRGLVDLVAGLALSWKQLVTITVPVGSYQALLIPAYVLAFAGTVVTLTVALRSKVPELALVAPLVVFTSAVVLGSETIATPLALTMAVAALSVVWLIWMRRRRRISRLVSLSSEHADGVRRSERSFAAARSVAIAVLAVALALVAAAGVASGLPPVAARTVARSATTPPFDPRNYPSPLSGFRSYLQPAGAGDALFTVQGVGDVRRLSIATMDTYDGVVYTVGASQGDSGAFARIPDTLSVAAASGARARTHTLDITVDGLAGPWLPTFGQLEHISFGGSSPDSLREGFYYNPTTATMAEISTLRSGDSYRITAVATPTKTFAQLVDARPGDAQLPALDVVPARLDDTLHRYEGGSVSAGAKLANALRKLADTGYISHGIGKDVKSLSGHGADRIDSLLTEQPMVGDQEQYAVAAALMARRIGFPARVVLGFAVPQKAGSTVTLTGADVTAWIQVQTAKDGWVDVDPNPQVRPIPQKQPDQPKQISRPQSVVEPPKDNTDHEQNPPPQAHVAQQRDNRMPAWLSILLATLIVFGWVLLVIALVVSPFLAVIAAKWQRRRTRRSPRVLPRGRISGAWREFADMAVDHGYIPPGTATRSEVAKTVGGPRGVLLAAVADRSAFGKAEPTEEDAEQVWRAVDELRRDLDGRTGRWGRLRARISLRSLGGYRGKTRGTDAVSGRRSQ
ncbi:transglutaminase-like domain-containing protein [Rathayibacter sp. KR2-224]|uniref:transglutaminase-like domain-containing protein n=1 Tax=Rathayibacter sp. KR2-224 TaxID=3400913 RepID=UPI003C0EA59A